MRRTCSTGTTRWSRRRVGRSTSHVQRRGPLAVTSIAGVSAITREQLQMAARNHGMPLEALVYPITPVGLHYLLIHYDIPVVDATAWRLVVNGEVERPLS